MQLESYLPHNSNGIRFYYMPFDEAFDVFVKFLFAAINDVVDLCC